MKLLDAIIKDNVEASLRAHPPSPMMKPKTLHPRRLGRNRRVKFNHVHRLYETDFEAQALTDTSSPMKTNSEPIKNGLIIDLTVSETRDSSISSVAILDADTETLETSSTDSSQENPAKKAPDATHLSHLTIHDEQEEQDIDSLYHFNSVNSTEFPNLKNLDVSPPHLLAKEVITSLEKTSETNKHDHDKSDANTSSVT